jgi:hypothetical protein
MSHGRLAVDGADDVGAGEDGTVPPVQETPLRANPAGAGLLPFHVPLKPKEVFPPVGRAAL